MFKKFVYNDVILTYSPKNSQMGKFSRETPYIISLSNKAHFKLQLLFEKLVDRVVHFGSRQACGAVSILAFKNCHIVHIFNIYLLSVAAAKWNILYRLKCLLCVYVYC